MLPPLTHTHSFIKNYFYSAACNIKKKATNCMDVCKHNAVLRAIFTSAIGGMLTFTGSKLIIGRILPFCASKVAIGFSALVSVVIAIAIYIHLKPQPHDPVLQPHGPVLQRNNTTAFSLKTLSTDVMIQVTNFLTHKEVFALKCVNSQTQHQIIASRLSCLHFGEEPTHFDLLNLRLGKFKTLKTFSAQYEYALDTLLASLSGLTTLKTLILESSWAITDDGLETLSNLTGLQTLSLNGGRITDTGCLQTLSKLTALQALSLSKCDRITDIGLQALSSCLNIKLLNLKACAWITPAGLQTLNGLTNIENLNLSSCKITDDGLLALSSLPNLKEINLNGSWITDNGLQTLKTFSNLQGLSLKYINFISDTILQQTLSHLTVLRKLKLYKISNNTLQSLNHLTNLQVLSLDECSFPDVLLTLSNLTSLKELSLANTGISDAQLQALSNLTALQTLSLKACWGISDDGLQAFKQSGRLQVIYHKNSGHVGPG